MGSLFKPPQRFAQQGAVKRFFTWKVAVDGARCVAGAARNFPHAGALDSQFQKRRTGGVQHKFAAYVGQGLLSTLARVVDRVGLFWGSALSVRGSYESLLHALSIRSEEHTSELQSREKLVCRLLLEK